jgi:pyrroline-5-carboxylate reductase
MSDTACKIRQGMTVSALSGTDDGNDVSDAVLEQTRSIARLLFLPLGRVRFLHEEHMDAVTGLSGCGPVFI